MQDDLNLENGTVIVQEQGDGIGNQVHTQISNSDLTNGIISVWNIDHEGRPTSWQIRNERQQISSTHYTVQLIQIPDDTQHIVIYVEDSNSGDYKEITQVFNYDDLQKPDTYYVHYANGIIKFSQNLAGLNMVASYFGRGVMYISDSRIFHNKKGNVTDTLDNILNRAEDGLNLVEQAGGLAQALQEIEEKTEEGREVIGQIEDTIHSAQMFGCMVDFTKQSFILKASKNVDGMLVVEAKELASVYAQLVAYKGGEPMVGVEVITQDGMDDNVFTENCSISFKNNTLSLNTIFDSTLGRARARVRIDIPKTQLYVQGDNEGVLSIYKDLEFSIIADGEDLYSLELSTPIYAFKANYDGYIIEEQTIEIDFEMLKAGVPVDITSLTYQTTSNSGLQITQLSNNKVMITAGVDITEEEPTIPASGLIVFNATGGGNSVTKNFVFTTVKEGKPASMLFLTGEQVFKYNNSTCTGYPNKQVITLTANIQNFESSPRFSWFFIDANGLQTQLVNGINANISSDGMTCSVYCWDFNEPETLTPNQDLNIWQGRTITTIRCIANSSTYDEISIYKIGTGENGQDSFNVILTNETTSITVDNSMNVVDSLANTFTDILCYCGTRKLTFEEVTFSISELHECAIKYGDVFLAPNGEARIQLTDIIEDVNEDEIDALCLEMEDGSEFESETQQDNPETEEHEHHFNLETMTTHGVITNDTSYVDFDVTYNGMTIRKRFTISKSMQGANGNDGDKGDSLYILVEGGTRTITYAQVNTDPRPAISQPFYARLYNNGIEVDSSQVSFTWKANGHVQGSGYGTYFTPSISPVMNESIGTNEVIVEGTYQTEAQINGTIQTVYQTIYYYVPIVVTRDAIGLDWVNEWDGTKTMVKDHAVFTPKIFAGSKDEHDRITGVAMGCDFLNDGQSTGLAGYQNDEVSFLLDTDGSLMVGNPFKNDGLGMYYSNGEFTLNVSSMQIVGVDVPTEDTIGDMITDQVGQVMDEFTTTVRDLEEKVNNFELEIEESLGDGVLGAEERAATQASFVSLTNIYENLMQQAQRVLTNQHLTNDVVISELETAISEYQIIYNNLAQVVENILAITSGMIPQSLTSSLYTQIENFKRETKQIQAAIDKALMNINQQYADEIIANAKSEIQKEVDDVSGALTNLETTMNGEFKSGLISQAKIKALLEHVDIITDELEDITAQYNALMESANLSNDKKIKLTELKGDLDIAHAVLTASIESSIPDYLFTDQEIATIKNNITTYNNALTAYNLHAQECNVDISLNISQGVVDSITDEEIFAKVTGQGIKQGLFIEDGDLYINGQYIQAYNFKAVNKTGDTTFFIDSDGNVEIKPKKFTITTSTQTNLATKEEVDQAISNNVGYTISMTNENQTIPVNSFGFPLEDKTYNTEVHVYKGASEITDFAIGEVRSSNGITTLVQNNKISFIVTTATMINGSSGVFTIPIIINGTTYNKAFSWAISAQGASMGASVCTIIADGQVFSSENGTTYTPNTITLTPLVQNAQFDKWQYLVGTDVFDIVSGQLGLTIDNATNKLTISNSTSLLQGNSTITFVATTDEPNVRDSYTIAKIKNGQDGKDGQDGQDGQSSPLVTLTGSQVFKYTDNYTSAATPSSITVTAHIQNIDNPTITWAYQRSGETTWNTLYGYTTETYTVNANDTTIFRNNNRAVTLRCLVNNTYYDSLTIVKVTDGYSPIKGIDYFDGADGINGINGTDGISTYFYVRYSANANGSSMVTTPSSTTLYMGTCSTTSPTAPTSPSEYKWSLIKGADGADGNDGTPGEKGEDGRTSYLHIKYSNDGQTFTPNNGEDLGLYIGTYVDFKENDSTNFSDYKWKKFVGEDGKNGLDGINGTDGQDGTSYYFYVRYSANSNGSNMTQQPTTNTEYMGVCTTQSSTAPTTPSSYTWTLIKGADGEQGIQGEKGTDGKSSYLHVKYSNDGGATFTGNNGEQVGEYIGTYVDNNPTDSSSVKSYTWVKIMGKDGTSVSIKGSYTLSEWNAIVNSLVIKAVSGDAYIVDGDLYAFDGTQFVNCGRIKGDAGTDGKSSYLHIKYSDDGKTFTSNNGETIGKYIGTYVDFVSADSTVFSDYTWKKYVGEDGKDGADGKDGVDGINAKTLSLSTTSHIIRSSDQGLTYEPSKIVVTADCQNTTPNKWYMSINGGTTFSEITSNQGKTTYTVQATNFTSNNIDTLILKCVSQDVTVYDTITLQKVVDSVDGIDGQDAYTIILTNESQVIPTTTNRVPVVNGEYYTDIIVYKGSTQRTDFTIGTISSGGGITVTKTSSRVNFAVSSNTALTMEGGKFTIPITIDGKTFNKVFNWSCSKQGEAGDSAKLISLTANSQVIRSNDGGITFSPATITVTATCQNATPNKWYISTNNGGSFSEISVYSGKNSGSFTLSDFTSNNTDILIVKCVCTDTSVFDIITLQKITDVTELQVGGENLVPKTREFNDIQYLGNSTSWIEQSIKYEDLTVRRSETRFLGIFPSNVTLKPNTLYTYSAYVKGDGVGTLTCSISNGNLLKCHNMERGQNLPEEWTRVAFTFDSGQNTSTGGVKPRFEAGSLDSGASIYICGIKLERGILPTDWSPHVKDLKDNIDDVANALNSFETSINGAFKDGIIEEMEAKAISQNLNVLNTEKADIDKEYSTVYNNTYLTGTPKTNLASAKTQYDTSHANLISGINSVISDGKTTESEATIVTTLFNTYNTNLATYKQRLQEALDNISTNKINNIEIGATNLVPNSAPTSGLWSASTNWSCSLVECILAPYGKAMRTTFNGTTDVTTTTSGGMHRGAISRDKFVDGETYTISAYIRASKNKKIAFYNELMTATNYINVTTEWQKYTFASTIDTSKEYHSNVIYVKESTSTGEWIEVHSLKLEKGNKATEWSPCPQELENSYTVVLTNESQVIPTSSERVPTSNATYYTDIQVYQGTTKRTDYTIGTVSSANGITVSKTTSRVSFAVSTGTKITADGGNFTIPITIDGKTFNKTFSWSCSKQGNTGADAYTIILTNENYSFACENNSNISSAITVTTDVIAYKGSTQVTPTIGTLPTVTGLTLSKSNATITIKANTGTSLASQGSFTIPITVDGKSFTKVFSWTKNKAGANGSNGANGLTVLLTNESQSFVVNSSRVATSAQTYTTDILVYSGASAATFTNNFTNTTQNGITATKTSNSRITFTVSANTTITADSGTFTIPIVVNGVTYNKVFTWSCSKGGQNGSNAQALTINASSTVIRSNDGGITFSPETINLTAICQNVAISKWQISSDGGSTFSDLDYGSQATLEVKLSSFENRNTETLVVKCISTSTGVYDTITLQRLIDVSDINVGSVNLLNNSNFDLNYPKNVANWSVMDGTVENGGGSCGSNCIYYNNTGSNNYDILRYPLHKTDGSMDTVIEKGQWYTLSFYIKSGSATSVQMSTFVYSSVIDTNAKCLVDGVIQSPRSDGFGQWSLTTEWVRHSYTFKTNTTFEATNQYMQFRVYPNSSVYICRPKLEKGVVATDWNYSPQDMTGYIDNTLTTLLERNNEIIEDINRMASDNFISELERADFKYNYDLLQKQHNVLYSTLTSMEINYLSGLASQLQNAWSNVETIAKPIIESGQSEGATSIRAVFLAYYDAYNNALYGMDTYTKDELTSITAKLSQHDTDITMSVTRSLQALDKANEVGKHMRFSDGWLELYATVNGEEGAFKTALSNEKLAFYENNSEVAYISNHKLNINNAVINNELQVGKVTITKSGNDGVVFRFEQ